MRAILTVIGADRVGIIAAISAALAERQVNILDITQTVMQEYFTMVMLVDLSNINVPFSELVDTLKARGEELGLEVRIQREDIFKSMHQI